MPVGEAWSPELRSPKGAIRDSQEEENAARVWAWDLEFP